MGHYFSASPERSSRPHSIPVSLRGREVTVEVDAGVFSATGLDPGTRVLLEHVPDPAPMGTLLDLGCGWGPIALAMAAASPQARVWAVDVNGRALELTAGNARRLGLNNVQVATGEQLLAAEPGLTVDSLWSNPPIRVGKSVLHELLGAWLPRLTPGGQAHLVVHKNLGSDSLQRWIEQELLLPAERIASSKGYRILRVHRATSSGR
ncbi:MAG TPA: methyltransferase [Ruania sp.]|nr:methyltransferase [Ruania sp.]